MLHGIILLNSRSKKLRSGSHRSCSLHVKLFFHGEPLHIFECSNYFLDIPKTGILVAISQNNRRVANDRSPAVFMAACVGRLVDRSWKSLRHCGQLEIATRARRVGSFHRAAHRESVPPRFSHASFCRMKRNIEISVDIFYFSKMCDSRCELDSAGWGGARRVCGNSPKNGGGIAIDFREG